MRASDGLIAFVTGLWGAAAGPASAVSLQQCYAAFEMDHHASEGSYEDLGSSLVMFSAYVSLEGRSGHVINFSDCRSGKIIEIDLSDAQSGQTDEARNRVRLLVRSERSYSFAEARDELEVAGFNVTLVTTEKELCACRVLYPQDRGAKKPYRLTPGLIELPEHETGRD